MSDKEVALRLAPDEVQAFLARNQDIHLRTSFGDDWCLAVPADDRSSQAVSALSDDRAVTDIVSVSSPYRLSAIEAAGDRHAVRLPGAAIGGQEGLVVFVNSSTGESSSASAVDSCGGSVWSVAVPSMMGPAGIDDWLGAVRERADANRLLLSVICSDVDQLEASAEVANAVELEAREMQNFSLLRAAGLLSVPVVLRRGRSATVEEFLLAAEYVLAEGNGRVILCEGVDPSPSSRSSRLELAVVAMLAKATHLPVAVDLRKLDAVPSMVTSLARASVAAGADALFLGLSSQEAGSVTAIRSAVKAAGEVAALLERPIERTIPNEDSLPSPAGTSPPRSPADILQRTDATLRSVIDEALGRPPRLEVITQKRIKPPYPSWLRWILKPEGDLLVRWTSYVDGDRVLTKNLAYVDFGRVDPSLLARLQAEEVNLGEIFSGQAVDRFGFAFGSGAEAGDFESILREGHGSQGLHPYVWRRYIAATSGRVGFLVIEALPIRVWADVLQDEAPGVEESR